MYYDFSLAMVERECASQDDCKNSVEVHGFQFDISTRTMCCKGDDCNTWSLKAMTDHADPLKNSHGDSMAIALHVIVINRVLLFLLNL